MPKKTKFGSYAQPQPAYGPAYGPPRPAHGPQRPGYGPKPQYQQLVRPGSGILSLPTTPLGIIGWLFIILLVGLWLSSYIVIWKTDGIGSKCGSFMKDQTVTGDPSKKDKE